jgi:nucleoside 2-deoxyribosyltransferase
MNAARYVYVIMPVGSDSLFADKKLALDTAIKKSGRKARFPAYHPDGRPFQLQELIEEIRKADSVVADLSHERPSCYYELGIAEAVGKQVHLIAQAGTPIHQCANRHAVRYYRDVTDVVRTVESALKE